MLRLPAMSHVVAGVPNYTHPEKVTAWGPRIALTVGVLCIIALALWGMRRGWQNRAKRQANIPAPLDAPTTDAPPLVPPIDGLYVATTTTDHWLDRVVVHSLGVPSKATLTIRPDGLLVDREGEPTFFVPVADISGVRLDRGLAGEVYEAGGLLIVTWSLGAAQLDTGFRADLTDDHVTAAKAIATLLESTHSSDGDTTNSTPDSVPTEGAS